MACSRSFAARAAAASVYDGLRDRLAAIAAAAKVGDGSEQGTVLGPMLLEGRGPVS